MKHDAFDEALRRRAQREKSALSTQAEERVARAIREGQARAASHARAQGERDTAAFVWPGEERQEEKLLEEIREIKRDIACNEGWFSVELDEDLIEACVYQGQALRARYRYLMRRARTEHVCARLFEAES